MGQSFGHAASGYAVEFEIAGVACRSLTVTSEMEAEALSAGIEQKEETNNVEVVSVA